MKSEELYSKVTRRMWRDENFLKLSRPKPSARELWIFLLTGPKCDTIPGLLPVGIYGLAEELEWSPEDVTTCLDEIEGSKANGRPMAVSDRKARLVWLPNGIHHNPPPNPSTVVGWADAWRRLPECTLRETAREAIRSALAVMDEEAIEDGGKGGLALAFDVATGRKTIKDAGLKVGRPPKKQLHDEPGTHPGTGVNHAQEPAANTPSPRVKPQADQQEQEQEQEQDQDQITTTTPPASVRDRARVESPPAEPANDRRPDPGENPDTLAALTELRRHVVIVASAAATPEGAEPRLLAAAEWLSGQALARALPISALLQTVTELGAEMTIAHGGSAPPAWEFMSRQLRKFAANASAEEPTKPTARAPPKGSVRNGKTTFQQCPDDATMHEQHENTRLM